MTRTEDRLADALHASADRVREDRLCPFPTLDPDARCDPAAGPRARRRAVWRAWLVPVAAAASVALIIGLAVAVTGAPQLAGPGRASGTSRTTAGFPTYFAQFIDTPNGVGPTVQVRYSGTGATVASVPSVQMPGWVLALHAIGASPDGHTFYLAYQAFGTVNSSSMSQIWIYRLSITGSGAAMPLTRIEGGDISVGAADYTSGGSLAVSPDGSKLALTIDNTDQRGHDSQGWADKIVVIDLATGARHVWRGGLYRSGKTFSIPDISWTADGRSLVFLAVWCSYPEFSSRCVSTSGPEGYRDAQVRSLSVGTGDGTLDRSAVLLAQSVRYPFIAAAVAGPAGAELNVAVLSGHPGSPGSWSEVAVERVSAVNGSLLGVVYRSVPRRGEKQPIGVDISPDPSGRYLLLTYSSPGEIYTGWIEAGKLHVLPVRQPYSGFLITAW
jgi:hypothetical protein